MATKGDDDPKDDRFTCALCLETYTDPRLLPCFHTYCNMCIEQLIQKSSEEGNFCCPVCRAKVTFTDGQDFPINIYIQTQLSFYTKELKCDLCEVDKNINSRCLECDQYLCINCSNFHQKIKSCKDHSVVEYTKSGEKSDTPSLKVKKNSYCTKHPDEILRFYCIQCSIPVCRDCKHTTHEGHKSEDVQDRVRDAANAIEFYRKQLRFEVSCLNNQRNSMVNLKKLLDKSMNSIDNLETDLCERVKQECSKLRSEMKQQSEKSVKSIAERKGEIEMLISRISSKSKYLEQTVEHGSDSDIIQCKSQILQSSDPSNGLHHKHLDLNIPALFANEHLSLPLPSLGQIKEGHLKMGLTLDLKETFDCSVTNKYVASICLKSTDEALVLFRHDVCSQGTEVKNVIIYTSNGTETASNIMPRQFDLVIGLDMQIYVFSERIGGISNFCKEGQEGKEKEECFHCTKPISLNIFRNGDFVILDTNLKISRVDFTRNKVLSVQDCAGTFESPMKAACDYDDNIWITDPGAEGIFVFDKSGNLKFKFDASEHLKLPGKFKPNGICMYNSYLNRAIVADPKNNCLFSISQDGQYCDVLLDHRNGLESPMCVACKDNKLWVCDRKTRIRVYEIKNDS